MSDAKPVKAWAIRTERGKFALWDSTKSVILARTRKKIVPYMINLGDTAVRVEIREVKYGRNSAQAS